jgi:hypothetical protein
MAHAVAELLVTPKTSSESPKKSFSRQQKRESSGMKNPESSDRNKESFMKYRLLTFLLKLLTIGILLSMGFVVGRWYPITKKTRSIQQPVPVASPTPKPKTVKKQK